MFGYIVVNQSEMKFKEYDVYRSYYCGLCQSLKERYGVLGQLSLNYDMTFILMLLTGLYEPKEQEDQCRCVAHPLEKHATRRNLFTDYVADMTVLFACYKAEDDWEDENSLRGLAYSHLLERKIHKKPLLYGEKVKNIALAMQDFADDYSNGIAGECNFLDDLTDDEKAKLDELLKKAIAKWATYIGSKATVDFIEGAETYVYEEAKK